MEEIFFIIQDDQDYCSALQDKVDYLARSKVTFGVYQACEGTTRALDFVMNAYVHDLLKDGNEK